MAICPSRHAENLGGYFTSRSERLDPADVRAMLSPYYLRLPQPYLVRCDALLAASA